MTATLLLIRHGEVEGSHRGMLLGSTDLPLSNAGRRQAVLLRGVAGEAAWLVCSPLSRTRETAEIAAAGRPVDTDPDLREIDFGDWEGLTYDQVERDFPALSAAWSEYAADFAFPGGESLAAFATRMDRIADRLARAEADTVAVFTHGGVIRSLICHFLGLPLHDYLLFDVAPASVTTLRLWEGRGVLRGMWPAEAVCSVAQGDASGDPSAAGASSDLRVADAAGGRNSGPI